MKNRPFSVVIVSLLFIFVGCIGFAYHLKELSDPNNLNETLLILFLRILAVVCGILLLFRISWARWLTIVWLVYHIIISAFNSIPEMIAHIAFLILVSILLFLPVSLKYFKIKTNSKYEKKFTK